VTWLPISHLILPLQMVIVADRYMLLPTLGLALAIGFAITRVPRPPVRAALAIAVCLAAALRTLDAQATWASPRELWSRAVESNPHDLGAWSMLAEAYDDAHLPDLAMAAVQRAREYGDSPRLELREALLLLGRGDRAAALPVLRRAAEGGEPKAMSNLALLEQGSQPDDALGWARRGAAAAPMSAHALRTLGKLALSAHPEEALPAFELAYRLEPSPDNRYNLGLGYLALHRAAEAIPLFEACVADGKPDARAALDEARRRL
jgi:tetratricopeptide (TPR) repeat protein